MTKVNVHYSIKPNNLEVLVQQPNSIISGNLESRYAECFMIDYDYLGLKDDKN